MIVGFFYNSLQFVRWRWWGWFSLNATRLTDLLNDWLIQCWTRVGPSVCSVYCNLNCVFCWHTGALAMTIKINMCVYKFEFFFFFVAIFSKKKKNKTQTDSYNHSTSNRFITITFCIRVSNFEMSFFFCSVFCCSLKIFLLFLLRLCFEA